MTKLVGVQEIGNKKSRNGVAAASYPRRVYPLDARSLSEEQIAVALAMTSRRPEPFDEIARQVSRETAAGFHERWVVGYGHASVAEHAVVHLAVENISRLAADALEDNRLASYTEKSSRYQIMPGDYFHTPAELDAHRCEYWRRFPNPPPNCLSAVCGKPPPIAARIATLFRP